MPIRATNRPTSQHRVIPARVLPIRRQQGTGPRGSPGREELGRGEPGLHQLLDRIDTAISRGSKHKRIRQLARQIVRTVRPGNSYGEIEAIFNYLAGPDEVPYRLDPVDAQIIVEACEAIDSQGVDCKGKTIVGGALVESLGYKVRPVTVDQNRRAPGPPNHHHIYLEVQVPGMKGWLPFDPVLSTRFGDARFGDELPVKDKIGWLHGQRRRTGS